MIQLARGAGGGRGTEDQDLLTMLIYTQEIDYAVSPATPLLSTAIEENGWVCGAIPPSAKYPEHDDHIQVFLKGNFLDHASYL
jgi:hypothetical protein